MRVLAFCLGLLLVLPGISVAAPEVFRVDDSGTVVSQPVVQMKWRRETAGRYFSTMVDADLVVALRLNVKPWLNRRVRLFMALAPVNGPQVAASWTTQGRLLPGTMQSGGRALVFEGKVAADLIEESILLSLSTDGGSMKPTQGLVFYFEAEPQ